MTGPGQTGSVDMDDIDWDPKHAGRDEPRWRAGPSLVLAVAMVVGLIAFGWAFIVVMETMMDVTVPWIPH